MKAKAWREKADVELQEQIDALRKELFQGQFRAGQDEVEERGRFKKTRREMARLLTLLREREKGIRGSRPVGSRAESAKKES